MKKIVPAPYIDQTACWVNGCESISSVMLLQAVGIPIDPDVFIERDLPHAPYWEQEGRLYGPDPMFVYPGDPHDHTGYGCYAPCIVQALQSALAHAGGVLGNAGFYPGARGAGPLAAGRWHRLCLEVPRALPAAGGLR